MSQLKEIEGKYFKECNVVMLPTENESGIYKAIKGKAINTRKDLFKKRDRWQPIELYITSDDEIKKGDWCYSIIYGIAQVTKIGVSGILYFDKEHFCLGGEELKEVKKIIATTDKSLSKGNLMQSAEERLSIINLPQPSHNFIKAYCEQGGIDKVLVEYNLEEELFNNPSGKWDTYTLKIDSHNTITIKPIKDSRNRKEIIEFIQRAWTSGSSFGDYEVLSQAKKEYEALLKDL